VIAFPKGERLSQQVAVSEGRRGIVLVVEDDEGVRTVMAAALADDGWSVQTAEHGKAALETVAKESPDAIILDLRMPVMDGLTFAERYRQFPEPRAPLILISATVTEAAIRTSGAVTGLRKPIDLDVLLETVARYARKS
jgi:two-component system, chemotaxis family, chemotaxis protein CheY